MIGGLLRPPVVLAYHGVGRADPEDDPERLVTSPELLASHIRMLQRRRYSFLTAEELLDAGGPRHRTAALTFDDGFADWLTDALPVLEALAVRATFYVCPGLLGARARSVHGEHGRLLDDDGVRALHAAGMELGAHSMTHPDLRLLDDAALAHEVRESKAAVERITGAPCRTFAYPYGLYDLRVAAAVRDAGYELAFAWAPGRWRRFAASRLPAPPRHGAGRLSLKLLGIRRPALLR
jgi:peptidoglycan/xylan/chitin deacetylase (PgdA/CDA1 family)